MRGGPPGPERLEEWRAPLRGALLPQTENRPLVFLSILKGLFCPLCLSYHLTTHTPRTGRKPPRPILTSLCPANPLDSEEPPCFWTDLQEHSSPTQAIRRARDFSQPPLQWGLRDPDQPHPCQGAPAAWTAAEPTLEGCRGQSWGLARNPAQWQSLPLPNPAEDGDPDPQCPQQVLLPVAAFGLDGHPELCVWSGRDGGGGSGEKVAWTRDRDRKGEAASVQEWWPLAPRQAWEDSQPWPLAQLPAIWTQRPVSWGRTECLE